MVWYRMSLYHCANLNPPTPAPYAVGCNKMTCPCGAYVCYICRANISKSKYAHFCQQPHCSHKSCGNCTLYSDSAADDQLAMRDAGLKVRFNLSSVFLAISICGVVTLIGFFNINIVYVIAGNRVCQS